MIKAQAVGGKLEVSTGSPPQLWVKTTKGRVSSPEASRKTRRRRSLELQNHRWDISGGALGAQSQLADELTRLQRAEQDALLRDADFALQKPGKDIALALKADLHLPWYRLRKLWQWLSSFGMKLASEKTMRQQI